MKKSPLRRPRLHARPLGQEPNPRAFDDLREMEEAIQALRSGLRLKDKRRTPWHSSTS